MVSFGGGKVSARVSFKPERGADAFRCAGEACGDYLLAKHEEVRLIHVGVPDVYVEHGGVDQLKKTLHMDADSIVERICSAMSDADD